MDWFNVSDKSKKETYFASPEKSSIFELSKEIETISKSNIMDVVLYATGNLLAVLNKNRQVIASNDYFLKYLGIEDTEQILGLRPGEIVGCVHSADMEAGCGTSKYCSTCGAAIAIVTSLAENSAVERNCIIDINNGEKTLIFKVRAVPYEIENIKLIFLFLEDISDYEQLKNMERYFLHDLNNTIGAMSSYIELLKHETSSLNTIMSPLYVDSLSELLKRLIKEIASQKAIMNNNTKYATTNFQNISISYLLSSLRDFFKKHELGKEKDFYIDWNFQEKSLCTDEGIVIRILINMLINAFEHTDNEVKMWVDVEKDSITFNVWNSQQIDEKTSMRIFQKYFSTKQVEGRGFGTFSMKFLGEKILKGKVYFKTSQEGTVFSFKHPLFEE